MLYITIHFISRVFLNLSGIQDIEEITEKASELMDQVDSNQDGRISRQEWRKSWSSVDSLRMFRDKVTDDGLKAEMVAKYGKSGPENIPLYAYGNKMSFYRLPSYPTLPQARPEGTNIYTYLSNESDIYLCS